MTITASSKTRPHATILALLLVIAIDCMGFGFIFPILTPLFLHGHHAIVPPGISTGLRDILYGVIVAVYPLCMFFGAPILGDLSDSIGRKKALAICLIGTAGGYWVAGFGITYNSFSLLLLGRIIDGLTAGSLSLAQAAIADVSRNSGNQTKYMGLMMFAIAAGQVLGPLFAGVLSDQQLSHHFTFALPFYAVVLLTGLNLLWLLFAFKETYTVNQNQKLHFTKTLKSFLNIFNSKSLILLSAVFFCMQLSWSFYSQASPAYLQENFQYGNFSLGLFSAGLGVFIAIGGTVLLPLLLKKKSTQTSSIIALALMAFGVFIAIIWVNPILFWLGLIINTMGAAMAFSLIITLFSEAVDPSKQGWIMGWTGAIIAAAWTITAVFTGLLMIITTSLALWTAGFMAVLGGYFMWRFTQGFYAHSEA